MTVLPPVRAAGWFGKGTTVRNSSGKAPRRGSGKGAASAGRNVPSGAASCRLPPPQSANRQEAMPKLPGYRQQAELEAGLRTGTVAILTCSGVNSKAVVTAKMPTSSPYTGPCVGQNYNLHSRCIVQGASSGSNSGSMPGPMARRHMPPCLACQWTSSLRCALYRQDI